MNAERTLTERFPGRLHEVKAMLEICNEKEQAKLSHLLQTNDDLTAFLEAAEDGVRGMQSCLQSLEGTYGPTPKPLSFSETIRGLL